MMNAGSIGFVKGFYPIRVQLFVADPGGKQKWKSGHFLPGFPEIINMSRYRSLFQCPVANDHGAGRSLYLIQKAGAGFFKLRGDRPILFKQYYFHGHGGPALVVEENGLQVFNRNIAEKANGSHRPVASDTITGIDIVYRHFRDDGDGHQTNVYFIF
jgi:hypothetical protein